MTLLDIRYIVKFFLDLNSLWVELKKNNMSGFTRARSFLKKHKQTLKERLSENIKRCSSEVCSDIINSYFNKLKITLKYVNPEVILNYDETNFTDDPGKVNVIVR